ncbi:hypothetical protein COCON_G00099020 [Conger conger]|uniref:Secreted protein n=1 Tax=Conger conger TaxID=82655 RepID=A0A9Q1DMH0_CONCO|nr:hypothetical protein COCON_G00099020 [Conger conger]
MNQHSRARSARNAIIALTVLPLTHSCPLSSSPLHHSTDIDFGREQIGAPPKCAPPASATTHPPGVPPPAQLRQSVCVAMMVLNGSARRFLVFRGTPVAFASLRHASWCTPLTLILSAE